MRIFHKLIRTVDNVLEILDLFLNVVLLKALTPVNACVVELPCYDVSTILLYNNVVKAGFYHPSVTIFLYASCTVNGRQ